VRGDQNESGPPRPPAARSPAALRGLESKYQTLLAHPSGQDVPALGEICAAATVRRSHHEHRLALVARPRQAGEKLAAHIAGSPVQCLRTGRAHGEHRLIFAFCGQGAHWIGMGRRLLGEEDVFRDALLA